MTKRSNKVSYILLGLILMIPAGSVFGTGLLTNPSSTFSFDGSLEGSEGGSVPDDFFNSPVILVSQPLPFSDSGTESSNFGYAESNYFIDISSDFLPINDSLELHLDLGVAGNVFGGWDSWSQWGSELDGSLVTFFETQDWTASQLTVSMAWALTEIGSSGGATPVVNSVTIRGPLDADWTVQTGFIFEKTVDIPPNWFEVFSVFYQETVNLTAGTYMVDFNSHLSSGGQRDGSESTSYGIDMGNDVTIWSQGTIDPDGCLAGVPCPTAADIDGNEAVDSADFHLWYQNQVDVTGDGLTNTADEAAMAYLLGLDMIDADGNGIVDGLAPSPVLPGAALTSAVELHAAYPNPFNPMTVLSFSLPSDQPVDLAIFDVKGNRIRTLLASETYGAGRHEVTWNGRDDAGLPTPAGVYFFRLGTRSDIQTGRMMLLK
jgi:hypothetical protein